MGALRAPASLIAKTKDMELKISKALNDKLVEAQGIIRKVTGKKNQAKSKIIAKCVNIGFEAWDDNRIGFPLQPPTLDDGVICSIAFEVELKMAIRALKLDLFLLLGRPVTTHELVNTFVWYGIDIYTRPYLEIIENL